MKSLTAVAACAALCAFGAPKYVFTFIGDGMSTPQRMVADEFGRLSGHGALTMNAFPHQSLTRTRSANAVITDSAAAATAIACGEKTDNGMLGVTPDGTRLESVAELAHKRGMKVGILTTVTIVHATPAGFYAHRKNRGQTYRVGLDLVDSGFEFFAGGGLYNKYDDRADPEYRGNVFDLAAKAGYRIVDTKAAFDALPPGGKTWGVFTNDFNREALPFALDGFGASPSLAHMLERAIAQLDGPQGFFIMCEGGKLDYVAHANDAAGMLHEALALDDAVRVADAFRRAHPAETLIVTTGDHETGGLSMGFAGTGGKFLVDRLRQQKCTGAALDRRLLDLLKTRGEATTFADAQALVEAGFGFRFAGDAAGDPAVLTAKETAAIKAAYENDRAKILAGRKDTKAHDVQRTFKFAATVKNILARRAGVGWGSGCHTALPTMTTAVGAGAERFSGFVENCEVARNLKKVLSE